MEKPTTNDPGAARKRKAPGGNPFTALTRESPASENPDAAALTTKRGRPLFHYEGHLYTKDKASKQDPSLTFWRCIKKDECKGWLVTQNGVFNAIKCGHTHDPSAAETGARRVATSSEAEL